VFENEVLKIISESKKDEISVEFMISHDEVVDLRTSSISRALTSTRLRCVGQEA